MVDPEALVSGPSEDTYTSVHCLTLTPGSDRFYITFVEQKFVAGTIKMEQFHTHFKRQI